MDDTLFGLSPQSQLYDREHRITKAEVHHTVPLKPGQGPRGPDHGCRTFEVDHAKVRRGAFVRCIGPKLMGCYGGSQSRLRPEPFRQREPSRWFARIAPVGCANWRSALELRLIWVLLLANLAMSSALLPAEALADARCSGHKALSKPRPEGSCREIVPEIFVSPDKLLRALVLPADISLDTTPDMESRVVIRSNSGNTLTSKDHSSPRGMNGYYVYRAKWSPTSQFFVYSWYPRAAIPPGHSPSWFLAAKIRRLRGLAT